MFHGGTTFGFLNGANTSKEFPYYLADVTSYGKHQTVYLQKLGVFIDCTLHTTTVTASVIPTPTCHRCRRHCHFQGLGIVALSRLSITIQKSVDSHPVFILPVDL
jgi:hypothetical protein